jgi:hypothetical protein
MSDVQGSAAAIDRSSVYADNRPAGRMNIGDLALLIYIARSEALDAQVRGDMEEMQERTDWLKDANSALAALRVNRPDAESGGVEYGTFIDHDGNVQDVHDWLKSNGIDIATNNMSTVGGNQADFDAAIANAKAAIDTSNSESQLKMISLQGGMDKLNQTTDLATNAVAKDSKSKDTVIGNMR